MLLPPEASVIAKKLGLGEEQFIKSKCILLASLYQCNETHNRLVINSQLFPKKVALFVEQSLGFLPTRFLVLPSLALKRNNAAECVFLNKGKCEIHGFAPSICRLFPFISISKKPLKEIYPFCAALQQKGFKKAIGSLDKKQKKKVRAYFDSLKRKGFNKIWKHFPNKGVFLLENADELRVSKKQFMQSIQPIL